MKKLIVACLALGMAVACLSGDVAVATWTGAAGDGDLSNAANWSCVDASNTVVANGLPNDGTKIVLTGSIGVDFPVDMSFAFDSVVVDGTAVLTRNCDWRGLGDITFEVGAKLDLAGHRLEMPTTRKLQLRPVEYIESTGEQIINTGVVPGPTTSLDIDFGTTEYASESTLFATMNWNQNEYMLTLRGDRGSQEFCWFGDYKFAPFYANRHLRLTVNSTNGALTFFDGDTSEQIAQIATTAFNCKCGKPLSIFGQNDGSKSGKYRIYRFKITQDGTLVRDFVPVRGVRRQGVSGLYDTVNGKFYSADGLLNGDDIAGDWYDEGATEARISVSSSASEVAGYAPVDYIESTGSQVVLTGIVPDATTSLDIDFTTFDYVQEASLFATQGWNVRMYMFTLQGDQFRWFGNAEMFTYYANRRLRMNFNSTDKKIYVYDGVTSELLNTVAVGDNSFTNTNGKQLSLFGQNDGTKAGRYRIHAFKITKGGTLVRDYVPMVRLSDLQPGLYDKVTAVFHTATGLLSPFVPPEITDSSARTNTFRPTEWIQSTGAQVILTGIVPGPTTSLDIDFTTFDYVYEASLFATQGWNVRMYMFTLNDNQFRWFGNAEMFTYYANRRLRMNFNSTDKKIYVYDGVTSELLNTVAVGDNSFTNTSGKQLSLFGQNDGTKSGRYRIHAFKIIQGGTLVRDFVPGYSTVEKRYGLYDRVSETFFGADNLLAGPFVDYATTVSGGVAVFDVPAGFSYDTQTALFTGGLALEKNGAGSFQLSQASASTGVITVNGGVFFTTASASNPLGQCGNKIVIGAAGTFDIKEKSNLFTYVFSVAGGHIVNSGASMKSSVACLGTLSLTADTTFDVAASWGMVGESGDAATRLDLGGHTLTLSIGSSAVFYLFNTTMTSGKLVLNGSGTAWVGGTSDLHAEDAEIVHNCAGLPLAHDILVRDFTDNSQNTTGIGDGVIKVTGRYAATTDAYRACEIEDGATIDLSARTTALATGSAATGLAGQKLAFANNAAITLDLGERRVSDTVPVVSWTTAPDNLDSLRFTAISARPLVKYLTKVRDNGIYVWSCSTIIIIR